MASAEVEWHLNRTLPLDQAPIDIQVSANGKWIYVLDDQGQLSIFTATGKPVDRIPVGRHVDRIKAGPQEDTLFLSSRDKRTVQVMSLVYVRDIATAGAPFKGPDDAPVTLVVFSDFQ